MTLMGIGQNERRAKDPSEDATVRQWNRRGGTKRVLSGTLAPNPAKYAALSGVGGVMRRANPGEYRKEQKIRVWRADDGKK